MGMIRSFLGGVNFCPQQKSRTQHSPHMAVLKIVPSLENHKVGKYVSKLDLKLLGYVRVKFLSIVG